MLPEGTVASSALNTCKAEDSLHRFQSKLQILSAVLRLKAVPLGNKCHEPGCAHREGGSFMCSETSGERRLLPVWFMTAQKLDCPAEFHRNQ